jgi:hypothetical protein
MEIGQRLGGLGLLEQHFGQIGFVPVRLIAPGKIPFIFLKPGDEFLTK